MNIFLLTGSAVPNPVASVPQTTEAESAIPAEKQTGTEGDTDFFNVFQESGRNAAASEDQAEEIKRPSLPTGEAESGVNDPDVADVKVGNTEVSEEALLPAPADRPVTLRTEPLVPLKTSKAGAVVDREVTSVLPIREKAVQASEVTPKEAGKQPENLPKTVLPVLDKSAFSPASLALQKQAGQVGAEKVQLAQRPTAEKAPDVSGVRLATPIAEESAARPVVSDATGPAQQRDVPNTQPPKVRLYQETSLQPFRAVATAQADDPAKPVLIKGDAPSVRAALPAKPEPAGPLVSKVQPDGAQTKALKAVSASPLPSPDSVTPRQAQPAAAPDATYLTAREGQTPVRPETSLANPSKVNVRTIAQVTTSSDASVQIASPLKAEPVAPSAEVPRTAEAVDVPTSVTPSKPAPVVASQRPDFASPTPQTPVVKEGAVAAEQIQPKAPRVTEAVIPTKPESTAVPVQVSQMIKRTAPDRFEDRPARESVLPARVTGSPTSPYIVHAINPAQNPAPISKGAVQDSVLKASPLAPVDAIPLTATDAPAQTTTQTVANTAPTRQDLPMLIARQIAEAAPQLPNRPVDISLSPEELGRVRLSLSANEAGLVINVLAERPETLDLMRRNIAALGQEFQALGYEDVAFSFSGGDAPMADADSSERSDKTSGDLLDGDDVSAAEEQKPKSSPITTMPDQGLDIRI
jgi:hypothetical protein